MISKKSTNGLLPNFTNPYNPLDPINPVKNGNMKLENLTPKVIHCAYAVYNTFRFGFFENMYHKAMSIDLAKANLSA